MQSKVNDDDWRPIPQFGDEYPGLITRELTSLEFCESEDDSIVVTATYVFQPKQS